MLLGYDANPERAEKLAEFLEAPLPPALSESFRAELAEVRAEVVLLADVARLFVRSPAAFQLNPTRGDHSAALLGSLL